MKFFKKALTSFFLCGACSFAFAQKISETAPVLLYADRVTYEQDLGILVASGHVEIEQEGRILEADAVTYNENTDIVSASGHVRLRDTDGNVTFVEYFVLRGDLKEGVAQEARLLMHDQSRLAAAQLRRMNEGKTTEFDQASYTPCARCQDHPDAPPLWQIDARQVIRDTEAGEITYVDADLKFLDFPIFYMPYLNIPLDRRSGFLMPSVGSSSALGAYVGTPYYWVIDAKDGSQDFVFTPRLTTKQGIILSGIYRQRWMTGKLKIDGSLNATGSQPKTGSSGEANLSETRGHFFLDGKFDANDRWRWGFQERQVSDKSYLKTRPFFNASDIALLTADPVLESRYFAEGFSPQDYLSVEGFHYIGLRDQARFRNTPLVAPVLDYHHTTTPGVWGSFFTLNTNVMSLYRIEGNRSQRMVVDGKGYLPHTTPLGQVYTLFGRLRGDVYHTEIVDQNNRKIYNGVTPRFFPQVGVDWRWPFLQPSYGVIIEPIVQVIGGASGNPTYKIPDEDSQGFEFNESNLLLPDRFPGLDHLDYGSRTNYGVQFLSRDTPLGTTLFFLGQNYSFTKPSNGLKGTGIGTKFSDIVGRLSLMPSWDWFSFNYRFRLSQKDLASRYNETEANIGPPILNLSATYVFTSPEETSPSSQKFQQVGLTLNSQFTPLLSGHLTTTRNLKNDSKRWETLSQGAGLTYQDECLTAGAWAYRTYYQAQGVRPGATFLFSVVFKNLGGVSYKANDASKSSEQAPNPFQTY